MIVPIEALYREIADGTEAQRAIGNRPLTQILDMMAEVELACMGFAGLTTVYGSALPDAIILSPPSPTVIRYPAAGGSEMTSLTWGQTLHGFPGGIRRHLHWVEIAVICGDRAQDSPSLMRESLRWLDLFDMTYSANASLNGTVKECSVNRARWGPIPFGRVNGVPRIYMGWKFQARIHAQYRYIGGSSSQ